mmetsp:Transcript_81937/g.206141  ORF Transcript_81937/g.206141 Transcript_81937/m.206141 type:complete len:232 (+) Transcript_81937:2155-2850(+)
MLQLPHAVAAGCSDPLRLPLHALELLLLVGREPQLPLRHALPQFAFFCLQPALLLLQQVDLCLQLLALVDVLVVARLQVLDPLLQEVEAAPGRDTLRVEPVQLRPRLQHGPVRLLRRQVRLRALPVGGVDALLLRVQRCLHLASLARGLHPGGGRLVQLLGDAMEAEEVELALQAVARGLHPPVLVGLLLLVRHSLLLVEGVALFREEIPRVVLPLSFLGRQALVVLLEGL